jgi:hypothetical protein
MRILSAKVRPNSHKLIKSQIKSQECLAKKLRRQKRIKDRKMQEE